MHKDEDPTSRCCFSVICFFTLAVGFVVGVMVGRYGICSEEEVQAPTVQHTNNGGEYDDEHLDSMLKNINLDNIRDHLRNLSQFPHLAGTPRNKQLADFIHSYWSDIGLDEVRDINYDVMLSYPDENRPNQVFLLDGTGAVIEASPLVEKVVTSEENDTEVVAPFLAYAKSGSVKGKMVYVNYGRVEDYDTLEQLNVNVTGHIVIARYTEISTEEIRSVMLAERHGASGVILYSDPKDYRPHDVTHVYPDDWWLPPTGAQRGSVFEGIDDPLTPGYPATAYAYRIKEEFADPKLPGIPAHVVGYGFAEKLLSRLGGKSAPGEWWGDLNITYNLGPDFQDPELTVRLTVTTSNVRRQITDVIGVIKGQVEPDRYIILGNHRDAWVFGAMDPSSGTTIMMELARVFMQEIEERKWRPSRTIVLCSWDAEEYALLGSTEFVQEYVKNLFNRAVAYLNVDIAVEGNYTLRVKATPLLYETAVQASKKVVSPEGSETSVYDEWRTRKEMKTANDTGLGIPSYSFPGSGSDYANFLLIAGVPVLDFRYIYNDTRWHLPSYPLFHSEYETFYAVEHFVDPEFKYHGALGQVWLSAAFILSERVFLPFNVSFYAWTLQTLKEQLDADYGALLEQHLPGYDLNLTMVMNDFADTASEFMSRKDRISKSDILSVRRYNDQLHQLERAFLDPNGIPGRTYFKHILFAPSSVNSYAGSSFPGLTDLLYKIEESADSESQWEKVKQHFSVILLTIQSATSTMREAADFL